MHDRAELGIKYVWMHRSYGWMHRSYGAGSVSGTAYGREHGITVIDGGCPLMFQPTGDLGRTAMRMSYRSHVPRPSDH
jgi:uncharacterized protein